MIVFIRYCIKTYHGHTDWVRCVTVSPDGSLLASGSNDQVNPYSLTTHNYSSLQQTVRVWVLSTKECKMELRGHDHVVECVAWAGDTALIPVAEAVGMQVTSGCVILDHF